MFWNNYAIIIYDTGLNVYSNRITIDQSRIDFSFWTKTLMHLLHFHKFKETRDWGVGMMNYRVLAHFQQPTKQIVNLLGYSDKHGKGHITEP